jgi:hypothetical protein
MPCATGAEQIRRAIAVRARVGYLQREVECKVKFDSFVDPSQRALPNLSMRRGSNLKALAPGNLDFGTARDEAGQRDTPPVSTPSYVPGTCINCY